MIDIISCNGNRIEVKLSLYLFRDEGVYIVYSPTLDLLGYGNTKKESCKSFECVLSGYLEYCVENSTLLRDLDRNRWMLDVRRI